MKQNLTYDTTEIVKQIFSLISYYFSVSETKQRALEKVLILKFGCLFLLQVIFHLIKKFIILYLHIAMKPIGK